MLTFHFELKQDWERRPADAAHRLQQGVLYFQAVMPLHSTQVHVASFSLITKAA